MFDLDTLGAGCSQKDAYDHKKKVFQFKTRGAKVQLWFVLGSWCHYFLLCFIWLKLCVDLKLGLLKTERLKWRPVDNDRSNDYHSFDSKVKCSRYNPVVAQRVGTGIALLFHDRGTRRWWVVSSILPPVPILQEAEWAPGPVWRAENIVSTGIRSRTVQPVVSRYTDWATRSCVRCGWCRAQHHPHRTHDLRSGSQDHHPSKNSVQKTICCNSTSNAPDDGRMYPKHFELRIHQ